MEKTRDKVLKLLKDGYKEADIAKKLNLSQPTVNHHIKSLIKNNKITVREIADAKAKRKANNLNELTKKQQKILESISGLTDYEINCSDSYFNKMKYKFKDLSSLNKKLTKKQQSVYNLLAQGYSVTEIGDVLGLKQPTITYYKDCIIAKGYITDGELAEVQAKRKESKPIKLTEKQQKIYKCIIDEKDISQIIKSVECTRNYVNIVRRKLISLGLLEDKEILTERQSTILKLLREGYSCYEIKIELNVHRGSVYASKDSIIAKGYITEDEIKKARKKRKEQIKLANNKSKKIEEIEVLEVDEDIEILEVDEESELIIDDNINSLINILKILKEKEFINEVLNKKTPNEKIIISLKLGLSDGNLHSIEEISNLLCITHEEVYYVLSTLFNELSIYTKNKYNIDVGIINKGSLRLQNKEEN